MARIKENNENIESAKYIESTTEYKIFKHIQTQLDIQNYTPINFYELRNFCYYGYSNNLLRPKFWKLFLCYLPKNKFKTEHHLRERRKLYHFYLEKSLAVLKDNPTIDDVIEKDIRRMCIKPVNEFEISVSNWGGNLYSVSDTDKLENLNGLRHGTFSNEMTNVDQSNKEPTDMDPKDEKRQKITENLDGEEREKEESAFDEPKDQLEVEEKERLIKTTIIDDIVKDSSVSPQENQIIHEKSVPCTRILERKCQFLDLGDNILHRKALKRILLTFKVTNSGIGYTQGMHMVLAPIYYVFATSEDLEDQKYAEEDSFFCFFNLLSEIGENFVQEYDNDRTLGIKQKMQMIFKIVKKNDSNLHRVLEQKGLIDTHFTFRWISLMLCSEFDMDQIIVLWDKLFSDAYRFEMLIYCCAAIIILMKKAIMECDFEGCLKILQSNKKIDVLTVFTLADKMRRDSNKK